MKILFSGIGGRIGKTMHAALSKSGAAVMVGGVDPFANPAEFDCPVFKSFDEVNVAADVIIDFSVPATLNALLAYALKTKTNVVISTTGHTPEQLKLLSDAAAEIAVFKASNMSLGVNLLINLAKDAAKFLGSDFEIEIIEQHHNKKLDSPSGTALTLAEAINGVLDNRLQYVYGRHNPAERRKRDEIGIHAIRGGGIVGKHDVLFIGQGETLTLSHESMNTEVFVLGSLRAAAYIENKKCGFFDMNSILGSYYSVTSLSSETDNTLISISGVDFAAFNELLRRLNDHNVNLDMISQTIGKEGLSVSFTLRSVDNLHAYNALAELRLPYTEITGAAKLSAEGAGMAHRSGVAMEVLGILEKVGATVFAITTSETKISCCINPEALAEAERLLKEYYGI
ncbi:MAG TPA: 4-hydroxy-tetrahydrodipicolinate reductase [Eubacteriales bacterium]|jgi:4-hydroxy-tetrahydrodipicolinate reductase|nr:4-hydroxy-tetrahydrodipicolinate reductase [Clostridia bacterium]HRR89805.1 4-hydroxy-tetrahydrodipicolinate reductase [Eubacteriales bacterium]HRU84317.1 4-hydroxy-tetrahydrodipicolinate reductase [Eubacteriales bacterium]